MSSLRNLDELPEPKFHKDSLQYRYMYGPALIVSTSIHTNQTKIYIKPSGQFPNKKSSG